MIEIKPQIVFASTQHAFKWYAKEARKRFIYFKLTPHSSCSTLKLYCFEIATARIFKFDEKSIEIVHPSIPFFAASKREAIVEKLIGEF